MLQKQDEIEELNNEEMTEEKFWGMIGLNADADDDFDYGRDFIKEAGITYDNRIEKTLPYEALILFLKPDWYKNGT